MQPWSIGIVCALIWTLPVAAAEPKETQPEPTSWSPSAPLQASALFAAGGGEPASPDRGAWISSDGKSIAFLNRESSAAEGTARALVVKDVETDAVVFEKVLFSEEESLRRSGPELERLARSRAWEARSYLGQREWKPLLYRENPQHDAEFFSDACFIQRQRPKRSVSLEDLKLSYQEPRLQIWRRGKKVLDRRFPSWGVRQQGCEHASPSWLNGTFVNLERNVVLIELGFCGVDSCPEPPAAFHVLRLPPDKSRAASTPPTQTKAPPQGPFVGYEKPNAVSASLYATGFPAISEDGTLVALAEVFADGERKDPNLLITVRNSQTNEVAWKLPVLEAGEVSPVQRSLPLSQALDKKVLERIRQVNDSLGRTQWVTLEEQPLQPMMTESCQQAPTQKLQLPQLEMTFNQGHLVLKRAGSAPPIELKLNRGSDSGADACKAASRIFMDTAYMDSTRGVVLLRLTTCGDEACPAQDRWYHSIKLR
ncbi:MAG TPA: hypothetical protein VFZ09_10740 [Archangium sp.]|uniref:hypothetical protein n=1 Tax=Archangium sp. TaxID=1872627 RepID=UPI002E35A654|nr:hypothetical protein [Archangium sp.]HEX5746714.1 hypothetical protein [Archangium sp.]